MTSNPFSKNNSQKRPLFFDIESGGLSGRKSSIYSISWSSSQTGASSVYAKPQVGTFISKWAKANVWEPIKKLGRPIGTERHALETFLSTLEAQKGGIIAGWNIGYVPEPQSPEIKGFDIPMLTTRAGKYGLRERYQKAFQNVQIRDIGVEYSYRLARGLKDYPELIDENLYGQIKGYNKLADQYLFNRPNATVPEIARHLGSGGYRLAGWKQEDIYKLMFNNKGYAAHQSEADIGAVQELAKHVNDLNVTPEFARNWNKEALKNTLISGLIKGNKGPGSYQAAIERANKFGITDYFNEQLATRVKELGGNLERVKAGYGVTEELIPVRSRLGSIVEGLRSPILQGIGEKFGSSAGALGRNLGGRLDLLASLGKQHSGKLLFGAAVAGLFAFKPLSIFSGKDDEFNTLVGLQHGGMAQKKRKEDTDFGSGYQGQVQEKKRQLTKHDQDVLARFQFFTENLHKYGTKAGTGHDRLVIPKSLLGTDKDLERVLGFVPVTIAIPEAGQDKFTSYRHPNMNYHIHSHDKYWTIHEDEEAALTMQIKNKGLTVGGFIGGLSHIFKEGVPGAYYYAKGLVNGAGDMAERLKEEMNPRFRYMLNHMRKLQPESMGTRIKKKINKAINFFSGADDDYNTIEGLRHGGMAEKKRHETTDFGSGWIRKALSKGVDVAHIAAGAAKLGTGTSGLSKLEFAEKLTGMLRSSPEEAMKFVRTSQGVHIGGEHFRLGEKFAEGGFGAVYKAYGSQSNKLAAWKVLHKAPEALPEGAILMGPAAGAAHEIIGGTPSGKKLASYMEQYSSQIQATGQKYGLAPGTLAYEAKMQQLARQQMGDIIPEVYGVTDKGLMTEFAGVGIEKDTASHLNALSWIEQRWGRDLTSSGEKVRHFDPQIKNIVRRGGKYRIIDFGVAAEGQALSNEAKEGAELSLQIYKDESSSNVRNAMARKLRFMQAHQNGVELASKNTLRPGQRHTQKTGKLITGTMKLG